MSDAVSDGIDGSDDSVSDDSVDRDHDPEYDINDDAKLDEESIENRNWDDSIIPGDTNEPNDDDDDANDIGGGIDGDGFRAMSVKNLHDDIEKGRAVKHQIGTKLAALY